MTFPFLPISLTSTSKEPMTTSIFPSRHRSATVAAAALLGLAPLLTCGTIGSAQTPKATTAPAPAATYQNPLVGHVADPYVLKHRGEYYLYFTSEGQGLGVYTSRDLVRWKAGPMVWRPDVPDQQNGDLAWAPEVYYEEGIFYMLFSADDPRSGGQRLWLATSKSPLGPFKTEAGPFSPAFRIDPHMFVDEDGSRYLYNCIASPAGPGAARVEARRFAGWSDRTTAETKTEVVIPPVLPWETGWTEAPTVWRDPVSPTPYYYMMYSGGGAHQPGYHTGYATSTNPMGPWIKQGILIDTVPGVPGPGHQCLTLAPDNVTPYLVYHAKRLVEEGWARDLYIDRLAYAPGGKLATTAPTLAPQPLPPLPRFADWFDREPSRDAYVFTNGEWRVDTGSGEMTQSNSGGGIARLKALPLPGDAVVEVYARASSGGSGGVSLNFGDVRVPVVLPATSSDEVRVGEARRPAPMGFQPGAYHQILLTLRRKNGEALITARLDGHPVGEATITGAGASLPATVELVSEAGGTVTFDGLAITPYADPLPLPDVPARQPLWGWRATEGGRALEQRLLGPGQQVYPVEKLQANALKGRSGASAAQPGIFHASVQGWALGRALPFPKYGLRVRGATDADYVEAWIDPATGVLATHGRIRGTEVPWQNSPLPLGFDYTDPHIVWISWDGGGVWRFGVDTDSATVQERKISQGGTSYRFGLLTEDARAVFRSVTVEAGKKR